MKLGKLPARKDAVKFKLAEYVDDTLLPPLPKSYGKDRLQANWLMLGNDKYGDCVWAGAGHETMLWNHEAAKTVLFNDTSVLSDYGAVTGFDPRQTQPDGSNPTDQGTDMQAAASYRRKTGVVDVSGNRHQVVAYLAITPKNVAELKQAIYLFGAVGIGIEFPNYAMDEFNAGQTWHVRSGGSIAGGHYIPAIGYDSRYVYVVSWGKVVRMTWGFFKKYNDETVAYVSEEMLVNGLSYEGFNSPQLQQDLKQLT